MSNRLPRTIVPSSYHVELVPDLAGLRFRGSVTAEAEVVERTDVLVCNCADLDLDEVTIDGEARSFTLDPETEQLRVQLGEMRPPGPIRLDAAFGGELNDQLKGFYRSTFTDDGTEQVIATTQMQSTDARRVFPCWDEPDLKARFTLTVVADPDLVVVSNSPEVARTSLDDGLVSIDFAPTMPMSTYLVAVVVGPLEVTQPAMAGTVPVRVVHRPGQGHLTDFALDAAVAGIRFFEDYYGIPYPAEKVDLIALPDFAMGAMENLGCITFREILLLIDPETATQPELQNSADVINHELAHMWFGDLVTMRWWNGIWLNEAFATFMEMKATDAYRPEWKRWTSFGMGRAAAFDVDSLEATRAIEYPVESPADAEDMFDLLTYEKGAAVVRMLEQWLGEDVFRDGIRLYLKRNAYGNTDTDDLWEALEEVSGRPVTRAMHGWIYQGGFPVIEADEKLRQRRFTYSGAGQPRRWIVPVRIRRTDGTTELLELDNGDAVAIRERADVVTFNHSGHGFYRVRLPSSSLAALGRSGTSHLDPVERFGLVDDTWSLTLAGEVRLEDLFGLLEGFRGETDVSVWQRIIGALGFVHHVAGDDVLPRLEARIADLIAMQRQALGNEPAADEPARTRQLRGALFAAAGRLAGDAAALADAERIHDSDDPDAEMLAAAVRVLAARGDQRRFVDFRHRYENAATPQEELRYLYALPEFPGADESDELVRMALGGDIRSQNAPFVLAQALMSRENGSAVWSSVRASWSRIEELFPSSTIVRLLSGVRWLTRPDDTASVLEFFETTGLPQGQKQLDQHLERLRVNRSFHSRVDEELPILLRG